MGPSDEQMNNLTAPYGTKTVKAPENSLASQLFGFGTLQAPKTMDEVLKPPIANGVVDPEVQRKMEAAAANERRQRGRASNILTSPQGLLDKPVLASHTLLGR